MRQPAKAKIAAALKKIHQSFANIGAVQVEQTGDDYADKFFTLDTKGGLLKLCASDYDFIHCRFEDVEAAKIALPVYLDGSRLNRYSGKWNFHFSLETIDQALEQFEFEVSRIQKEQAHV